MEIRTFQGYTPAADRVAEVTCVPYDVVDREEAVALAKGKAASLMHVDRAEIQFQSGVNPYSDEVYAAAKNHFESLIMQGALVREKAPCLYLYRLTMGDHVQVGVAATVLAADYEAGRIKKHEKTRPDKEDDRTRLIDTIAAQTGPILLAFRSTAEVDHELAILSQAPPDFDLTAEDGVRHEVWRILKSSKLVEAFDEVPAFYIADGHHRAASGARVAALRRGQGESDPHAPHEGILAVLFPAASLQVLAYNRVVRTLNGLSREAFLEALGAVMQVEEATHDVPTKARSCAMYLSGQWYHLSWDVEAELDPVSRLDVSVLQDRVLAPLLGIRDPRRSADIEFVGGIRGTQELVRRVENGQAAVAFSMFPTTVDEVMAIADADQIMPPKSTWFEPKLRSGFFIHSLLP